MGIGNIDSRIYRIGIATTLVLFLVLFVLILRYLPGQLQLLATAQGDVQQWTVSQLDTEFANLESTLAQRRAGEAVDDDAIRLRVDIALSRYDLVATGDIKRLLVEFGEATEDLTALRQVTDDLAAIVDAPGPLSDPDIARLRDITDAARTIARNVALAGVRVGAERTEARRDGVLRALVITGAVATTLLVMLAGLVMVLNTLLVRAAGRDADLVRYARRLQATVEASMDAILTTDGDGRVLAINAAGKRILGYRRSDILGRTLTETILPERNHSDAGPIADIKRAQQADGDPVARRADGSEFPVALEIAQVEGRDGAEYVVYIRDLSAQRMSERRLIDARDRAERTDTAKSRFLTVMSHEMRTPLNGILGVLDLLRTTPLTEVQARYAGIANASSQILLEQVNEALDITRIETGSLLLTPQPFAPATLVANVIEVLGPLAAEKALDLRAEVDSDLPPALMGDAGRIRQILTNLVGNGVKFTTEGHVAVKVTGRTRDGQVNLNITVSDTGPGIPIAEQERIFEEFVTLTPVGGRQVRGDGLGLSISRRIARQMGGDLTVSKGPGRGTTFLLTLPLPIASAPLAPVLPPDTSATKAEPRDVLVVEDNDINRSILSDMLRGQGHRVAEAETGDVALSLAQDHPFDLILMDISMPDLDGITATRRLRTTPGPNRYTNVIALTAHGQEEFREKARVAGMDGFETKPLRLDRLDGIISGHATAPDAPMNGLADLCARLGQDRTRAAVDAFFDDLEALAPLLAVGGPTLESAAHRSKGAAALLGFADLEQRLAQLEQTAQTGHPTDCSALGWANAVREARRGVQTVLDRGRHEPA